MFRSRARWTAFWLFAVALFAGTHWPRLTIDSPVAFTDKFIHAGVFCVWTLLLASATRAGAGGWHVRSLGMVAFGYASIDEMLQAIPALGRTASVQDLAANFAGILAAVGFVWLRSRGMGGRTTEAHTA